MNTYINSILEKAEKNSSSQALSNFQDLVGKEVVKANCIMLNKDTSKITDEYLRLVFFLKIPKREQEKNETMKRELIPVYKKLVEEYAKILQQKPFNEIFKAHCKWADAKINDNDKQSSLYLGELLSLT